MWIVSIHVIVSNTSTETAFTRPKPAASHNAPRRADAPPNTSDAPEQQERRERDDSRLRARRRALIQNALAAATAR